MKVLILGGVAAGTKVAAKLLRENRDCEVTVLTKGKDISYAGCGLPYYVGGVIQDRSQLIVNTPEKFAGLTGARVITQTEALAVHPAEHKVTARDLSSGQEQDYGYDKLVIATGASPFLPPVPGLELKNVFVMRTPDDAIALREALEAGEIKRAVVAGGGFIGLEVAENLAAKGVKTTVIDFAPHVLPNFLDPEMSEFVENRMAEILLPSSNSTSAPLTLYDILSRSADIYVPSYMSTSQTATEISRTPDSELPFIPASTCVHLFPNIQSVSPAENSYPLMNTLLSEAL